MSFGAFLRQASKSEANAQGLSRAPLAVLEQSIAEWFRQGNVSIDSGCITGGELLRWAQREKLPLYPSILRRCTPAFVSWEKLSYRQAIALVEAYLQEIHGRKMGVAKKADSLDTKPVVRLGIKDYFLYRTGKLTKEELCLRHNHLMGRSTSQSSLTGMESDSLSEFEWAQSLDPADAVNVVLDIKDIFSPSPRTTLFASSTLFFTLITVFILIFLWVSWSNAALSRQQQFVRNLAKSFSLFSEEFVLQHKSDVAFEMIDAATMIAGWFQQLRNDDIEELRVRLILEVRKASAGLVEVADAAKVSLLESAIDGFQTIDSLAAAGLSRAVLLESTSAVIDFLDTQFDFHLLSSCSSFRPFIFMSFATEAGFVTSPYSGTGIGPSICSLFSSSVGEFLVHNNGSFWVWDRSDPSLLTNVSYVFFNASNFGGSCIAIDPGAFSCAVASTVTSVVQQQQTEGRISQDTIREEKAAKEANPEKTNFFYNWNTSKRFPLSFDGVSNPIFHYAREFFVLWFPLEDNRFYPPSTPQCQHCWDSFETWLNQLKSQTPEMPRSTILPWIDGEQFLFAGQFHSALNGVYVLSYNWLQLLDCLRVRAALATDFVNQGVEPELALAARTEDFLRMLQLYHVDAPPVRPDRKLSIITRYAHSEECIGECLTVKETFSSVVEGFTTKGYGATIGPSYKAAPVMFSYSYIDEVLDMVVLLERDVKNIHQSALETLVEMISALNRVSSQVELTVSFLHWKGSPPTKSFDATAPCLRGVKCFRLDTNPSLGVLFRSDCVDCLRRNLSVPRIPAVISPAGEFPSNDSLSLSVLLWADDQNTATRKEQNVSLFFTSDTTAAAAILHQLGCVILLTYPSAKIQSAVLTETIKGILISAAVMLSLITVLVVLTYHVMDRVERASLRGRRELQKERHQFYRLVENSVPPFVREKILNNQLLISGVHEGVSVVSTDIVGFSEYLQGFSPIEMVTIATYSNVIHFEVARALGGIKLHCFGDSVISVFGLEKSYQSDAGPILDSCMNGAKYSALMIQLFSPTCEHSVVSCLSKRMELPLRIDSSALGGTSLRMPELRVGAHFGPLVSGTMILNPSPSFDCFGVSLSLAIRLQNTSLPSRIHVSAQFKEALQKVDSHRCFDFEPPRKTITKEHSMITSYLINSIHFPEPQSLLALLSLSHAHDRVFFEPQTTL